MQVLSILALTGAAYAAEVKIAVGAGGLVFTPSLATAEIGDTLVFSFEGNQHSVVESSANVPCQPLSDTFFSGIIAGSDPPTTTFSYNVTSTDPIYYYCSVHKHCQSGMVGIINPPNGNLSLSAYAAASKNATSNVSPDSAPGTGGILNDMAYKVNATASSTSTTAPSTQESIDVATVTSTVRTSSAMGQATASATSTGTDSGAEKGNGGVAVAFLGALMAMAGFFL